MSAWRWAAGPARLAALAVLLPATAHAHLVTTGLGPLYDGIGHLLLSPDDLVPVVAMALLAGLSGKAASRWALFVLPLAWVVGGLAGDRLHGPLPRGTPAGVSFLVLGILVATGRRLPPALVAVLAAALGLVHGWLNGVTLAVAGRDALGLAGIAVAAFVLVALMAAAVVSLRPPWTRIAVRVAGSWIAATGLLLLGWTLSGRG
ncbi:MAG TPA: HupE/UreJ family protein [Myxococcaceae bacterium]|nr:HupE/UreJ family protein [Myxococcaceae bacterium]